MFNSSAALAIQPEDATIAAEEAAYEKELERKSVLRKRIAGLYKQGWRILGYINEYRAEILKDLDHCPNILNVNMEGWAARELALVKELRNVRRSITRAREELRGERGQPQPTGPASDAVKLALENVLGAVIEVESAKTKEAETAAMARAATCRAELEAVAMPFTEAFTKFLRGAQDIIDRHFETRLANLTVPTLEADDDVAKLVARGVKGGRRFIRVWRKEGVGRSAHCFVDLWTGNVLKPDGFKKPAKGARGNIFNPNPVEFMTPHGTAYLK